MTGRCLKQIKDGSGMLVPAQTVGPGDGGGRRGHWTDQGNTRKARSLERWAICIWK